STASTKITVKKLNTKLALTVSNNSPVLNSSINITATLTDANNKKLANQDVTLNVAGKNYTVKTNSNGIAVQPYTPTKVETQTITATYKGDSQNNNSTNSTKITVKKIDTKLTLTVSNSTPINNTQINITATLTDSNNNKLANQEVILNINGQEYKVKTNKDGVISQLYTPTTVEKQNITVTYNGNGQYNSISKSTTITVRNKYNTKTVMSTTSGIIGEKLVLKATVTDENNKKVTDGNAIFKVNGVTIKDNGKLSGSDNPLKAKVTNGQATATIVPDVTMKNAKTITASYVGTDIYNKSVSAPANMTIAPRKAIIEITTNVKVIKQGQVLTITAKVYDTTNGKKSTNLTKFDGEFLYFKVNGITLNDSNGQTLKAQLVNGVATVKYTVPLGIAGIMDCKTMAIKNHTIIAGYYNNNYNTTSETPTFQVERSNLTLVISNVTANNKTHKLSLKVTIKDYLGNIVAGPNKFIIKLNGFSITNGTEPMYYYSVDGILTINNIDIPVYNKYNNVEVVTQDRLAYTSQRNTTTKIKVLN
ncbi:MAG: Ig-like domain repeat protein, partial [Methanosphaera sp.]|nr:Ig-like domain repeat protein [Methanosphaera sp.]